jgi:hypothetical protein
MRGACPEAGAPGRYVGTSVGRVPRTADAADAPKEAHPEQVTWRLTTSAEAKRRVGRGASRVLRLDPVRPLGTPGRTLLLEALTLVT